MGGLNPKHFKIADFQIHPRVCKEQADVITRLMSFEVLEIWTGPNGLEPRKYFPSFQEDQKGQPWKYRPVSLISVTGKIIDNILGATEETGTDLSLVTNYRT